MQARSRCDRSYIDRCKRTRFQRYLDELDYGNCRHGIVPRHASELTTERDDRSRSALAWMWIDPQLITAHISAHTNHAMNGNSAKSGGYRGAEESEHRSELNQWPTEGRSCNATACHGCRKQEQPGPRSLESTGKRGRLDIYALSRYQLRALPMF